MPISADPKLAKKETINPEQDVAKASQRWWLEDDDVIHNHVFPVAAMIANNMSGRRRQNYKYAMSYNDYDSNLGLSGQRGSAFGRGSSESNLSNKITLNVVQNCIDSAAAMISKNKPKPQFITDNGTYTQKVRAQKLTKYVAGVIEDCKLYDIGQRVFTDAGIYGTGCVKLFEDGDKLNAEWCFIEEILVDDMDGLKETPDQLHQRKYVSRDRLAAQYPDHADDIFACNSELTGEAATRTTTDTIAVIESWHLKSGKKAKDGKHTVCIESKTLLAESYDKRYFPIVFFRWYHQSSGFWGRGITQEIYRIQMEINQILRTIQEAQKMLAVPVIFVEHNSMVAEDHLASNEIGRFVEYSGTAPIVATPPAVQQELYQHLQTLKNEAYSIIGLNQNSATGSKPPSVTSGAAIREVQDIASGRFEVVGQNWEQFFMTISEIIIDMSKDMFKGNKDLAVKVKNKKSLETLKWSDVDLDDKEFGIDLFPVSGLPNTPAGRIQTITEYTQNGWIPKEQAMELLDFPDLEGFVSPETSTVKLTNEIISKIKEDGLSAWKPPSEFMDLQTAFRIASLEIVQSQIQNVPEEHIDLLIKWVTEVQDLMDQATQQAAAKQAASQPQQPATPQAPAGQPHHNKDN